MPAAFGELASLAPITEEAIPLTIAVEVTSREKPPLYKRTVAFLRKRDGVLIYGFMTLQNAANTGLGFDQV